MVFALDGKAKAPAGFPDPVVPPPLDLAAAVPTKGDAGAGYDTYVKYCMQCHRNGVYLPNLSRSPVILDPASLSTVVLGGALTPRGMPSFKAWLKDTDIENLRAFFLEEAKSRAPGESGVVIH